MRQERRNRSARTSGLPGAALGVLACVASAAWMSLGAQSPRMHLDLNLPAYRLDVYLRHERVRSYRVMIGGRGTRTPRGAFAISQLEWNPRRASAKRECAGSERITPRNPKPTVARMTLQLSPLLFVQGTAEAALGTPSSRGCVGLADKDVIDLATLIQRSMLGNVASDSLLAIVLPGVRPLVVKLHERIPIDIRYDPVDVIADTLFAYPDPYRLGTTPWKDARVALARAGLDTTAIDAARLRRMVRYPELTPVALPIRRSMSSGQSARQVSR